MGNNDELNVDFWNKLQKIKNDMSKASFEDIEMVLNYYNQGPIVIDGVNYHYKINPLEAACLNARYQELTGQDHPKFLSEQLKVLDEVLENEANIRINGNPSIYEKLRNNLTGEGPGIRILLSRKESYISKFEKIQYDISKASLEDVKEILDFYDQDAVLIDGIQYHFRPNVLQGASLNARYKELAGDDHPVFLKEQEKRLDEILKSPEGRALSIYKRLKDNDISIGGQDHILNKTHKIILEPQSASLEDISSLLDYYNGNPVLIDGVLNHPFNDPVVASKLNERYQELTGQNHPVFVEQTPKVIKSLMKDKNNLIKAGAYGYDYFDTLTQIMEGIEKTNDGQTQGESSGIVSKTKFAQIFEKTKGKTKGILDGLKNRFRMEDVQEKNSDVQEK